MQRARKVIPWLLFAGTLLLIALFTLLGPPEHSLGTHIRVVYLHGAWVWASLGAFLAAAISGAAAILSRREPFHCWSAAFGRTGLFFWITYLPLSLWAMQTNWNGLFLAEPRWRLALVFAIAGLLLQIGLALANRLMLTSALNLGYFLALMTAIVRTPNVMHPSSPILGSEAWRIQLFFYALTGLTLLAVWQMARWWYRRDPGCSSE